MRFRLAFGLIPLFLTALYAPGLQGGGSAQERLHIVWDDQTRGFGGFSGISVHPDSTHFVTVNDDGRIATGTILSAKRIRLDSLDMLFDASGKVYSGHDGDAEGMALGPDGFLYVAFEHRKTVTRFTEAGTDGTDLPAHPTFAEMADNQSLEALAIDGTGRTYTLPERPDFWSRSFPIFRFDNNKWTVVHRIPSRNGFRSVGADFGPDGAFYLLERRLTPLGFQSRIRRWKISGDTWQDEETVWRSRAGQFDNLEGLSLQRVGKAILRATMISDDNFWTMLDTEIVQIDFRE